jgi:hypothetical protein
MSTPELNDAEARKQQFVALVRALSALRDVQFGSDSCNAWVESAQNVVAENLPSNLLRAAAFFVDSKHGFPPEGGFCDQPRWIHFSSLLPESERGVLWSKFPAIAEAEVGDVVIALEDQHELKILAGSAAIIRTVDCGEAEEAGDMLEVEFGEPQLSKTILCSLPRSAFRTPRPGDLIEAFIR